jgi:hypothetical protein
MLAIQALLVIAAFVMTLVYAARHDYVPLWVPVLLIELALLLQFYPSLR